MSSSNRRSRFRVRVSEPYPDPITADVEACNENEAERETDFESMTAKGIKRLCSELMELRKSSDDDFHRNIYSNCSSFIRIFEEIGYAQNDILELKNHTLTQTNLIQTLLDNLYSDAAIKDFAENKVDFSLPTGSETHMEESKVTLDVLLTEQRLNEAIDCFEKITLDFQNLQNKNNQSSPIEISYMRTLSAMRTRIVNQLSLIAEHPRVSQPELRKALSNLFRLGENNRANSLLIKHYSSRIQKTTKDMQCSESCMYGTYIRELSRAVFSVISQAAKCFTNLNGETSSHSSELNAWIREEIMTFSHTFGAYVSSIHEMNGGLLLAIEAAKCATSFCSLLEYRRTIFLPYLIELITPCMQKMLRMHLVHFKNAVNIFTNADDWIASKFPRLGILKDKSMVTVIGEKVEYCQLTSSGRKFITLMQRIVDDISPLVILDMDASILEGITELFLEYINALKRAIPSRETTENTIANASHAHTIQQQLSVMVNASTIVQMFPSIACTVSKEIYNYSRRIEKALEQLKGYYCHQFVFGAMYHRYFEANACMDDLCMPNSSQDIVPSLAFQALFLRMRQLELLSKSMFSGDDWLAEILPKAIVEALAVWISNNKNFWSKTVENSCIVQHSCFEQVYIDMHFVMEFTEQEGYCSDELLDAAMDLIEEMDKMFLKNEPDPIWPVPDGEWASNVAKSTIKKLLENEAAKMEPKKEASCTSLDEFNEENEQYEHPTDSEHSLYSAIDSTDYESDNYTNNDLAETKDASKSENEDAVNLSLEKLTINYNVQVDNEEENIEDCVIHEHATDPYSGSNCTLDQQEIYKKENAVADKELVENSEENAVAAKESVEISKEIDANKAKLMLEENSEEKGNIFQAERDMLTTQTTKNKAAVNETLEVDWLKEIEGIEDSELHTLSTTAPVNELKSSTETESLLEGNELINESHAKLSSDMKLISVSKEDEPIQVTKKRNVFEEDVKNDLVINEKILEMFEENTYSFIHSQEFVQTRDYNTSDEVKNKNDFVNNSVTPFVIAESNVEDQSNMLGTESIEDRYDLISRNLSQLVIANATTSPNKQKHGSSRQRIVVKKRVNVRSSRVSAKFLEGSKGLVTETEEQKHASHSENEGYLTRQRSGRKRTKSNMDGNIMGKSSKAAKALRPRWQ